MIRRRGGADVAQPYRASIARSSGIYMDGVYPHSCFRSALAHSPGAYTIPSHTHIRLDASSPRAKFEPPHPNSKTTQSSRTAIGTHLQNPRPSREEPGGMQLTGRCAL